MDYSSYTAWQCNILNTSDNRDEHSGIQKHLFYGLFCQNYYNQIRALLQCMMHALLRAKNLIMMMIHIFCCSN